MMQLSSILGIGGLVVLAIAYQSKLIPLATAPAATVRVRRGSGGY